MLTTNGEGKKEASFATEDGIAAMQLLADMVKDQTALHISWEEGCQSFIDGNCAMLYTTIARRASVQKGAQFDVATVKSPLWNDKERMVPAGGCFLAITAQGDDQIKAAWEFEKFLYSVESMAAWTEGTGYVPPRKDVPRRCRPSGRADAFRYEGSDFGRTGHCRVRNEGNTGCHQPTAVSTVTGWRRHSTWLVI